jgi:hypothetical protein
MMTPWKVTRVDAVLLTVAAPVSLLIRPRRDHLRVSGIGPQQKKVRGARAIGWQLKSASLCHG